MIDHKDRMLKYLVKKFNLSLKGSIGVGDTEGDVPVLKLVDKPICFNPNKKLLLTLGAMVGPLWWRERT